MVQDRIIFGIDISKGSPGSKQPPRYAVAIRSNGNVEHHRMVSMHKLMRLIWQQRPQILAVDNIHELTKDRRDLVSFMRRLPQGTRMIQVTGGEHLQPLSGLARSRGLSFDRFDPNQEAEVCAALASMDVGAEISVFEDRTYIKVSRARSLGRGGWSQNRYRRKVHGHVRQKTREIEEALRELKRENGIDYTSNVVKGFGGYVRGEFMVNAPRSQLNLTSAKFGDVQVKVEQVERDAILFTSLKTQKRKYVIVGVDPGTTTGLALLDLEGSLVKLHSSREMSISDIIEMISQYGRPLMVSTDVNPIPGTVEKIRRSFNAVAGEPDESLATEDKITMAKPYGYRNDHERDAVAAAAYSFRKYKNKFDQIRKRVPPDLDADRVIAMVMKGDTIDSAISVLTGKQIKPEKAAEKVINETNERSIELTDTIKRQQETIDSLRSYLEELKSRIKQQKHIISLRDKKINKLKTRTYAEIRSTKEVQIRDDRIRQLEKTIKEKDRMIESLEDQVEELKRVRSLEVSGRTVPVKVVPTFTKEALTTLNEQYGLNPGDVLFFKDASGGGVAAVDILADSKVRAVIFRGDMAHNAVEAFFDKGLPFFNVRILPVHYVDDFGVVDPEELKISEEQFQKELQLRKQSEKEQLLDNLVQEYKSERRRGIL